MKKSTAMLMLLVVLAMPTASALDNTTFYFVPQDGTASSCGDTVVQVMAHAPYGLNGAQFAINYSTSCIEIVDVEFNTDWWNTGWNNTAMCFGPGHDWIKVWRSPDLGPGDVWVCNITINCIDPSCIYCKTHMDFMCGVTCSKCGFTAGNNSGALPVNATNGTFTCGVFPSAETFSKPLYIGWNLISLPLDPAEDNSASAVLSTVSYNTVYRYNATSKQFEGIASTDAMIPGTGYFVHATADCTWKYNGTANTSMDISLKQGLNMVGWLNCSKDIGNALSSISDDYYYVARWDTSAQKFKVHNPAAPPAFNDFTTMDRGTGYFVSAKQEYTLSENC